MPNERVIITADRSVISVNENAASFTLTGKNVACVVIATETRGIWKMAQLGGNMGPGGTASSIPPKKFAKGDKPGQY